jgi:DNA-binding CsgD family transcriptional regulator
LTRLAKEPIDEKQQGMLFALRALILGEAGGSSDAQQVVEEGLASISDPASQDFVRAQWAAILSTAGRDAEATEIAVPLVTNPRTDDLARLRAMATAVNGWNREGRLNTSLEELHGALPIAFARVDDLPDAVFWLGGALVLTEIVAGHLGAADALLTMSAEMAAGGQGFDPKQLATLARGRIAMLRGDVKGAVRLLASVASAPHSLVAEERAWAWALLAEAKAVLGDVTGAEEALTMADSCMNSSSSRYLDDIRRCRPWVAAASGELSRAADLAREAASWASQTENRPIELWCWHELARLGAPDEALAPLRRLASEVDGDWPPAFSIHVDALVAGDGPGLMVAADRFERIGACLHAAEAASEAASIFGRRGLRARASVAAARAAALAARCAGAQTPTLNLIADGPTLTRREREVALMAAAGLSSTKIGAQLDISRRTVEGHLQRAYEKLGVTRRSELAAVLSAKAMYGDGR